MRYGKKKYRFYKKDAEDGAGGGSSNNSGGDNSGNGGDQSGANSGQGGGSDNSGGGSDNSGGDGGSSAEYKEFLKWKKDQKSDDKSESAYDRIKREEQEKQRGKNDQATIEADIRFDLGFDDLVKKGAFNLDASSIRKAAETLEGAEKIHTIKCTALKDFFAKDENLLMLTEADQALIKSQVINQHDNNIDSRKYWVLLEQAMFTAERISLASGQRNKGGASDGATPVIDAFIEKAKKRSNGVQ